MQKVTTHTSFWKGLFFIINIAIASAQNLRPGQNDHRFPNAQVLTTQQEVANHDHPLPVVMEDGEQKALKYAFLDFEILQAGYPTISEQVTIDLPRLPVGGWNDTHIDPDRLEMMDDNWQPRKIDYLEFVIIEALQEDRLQIVTHPEFNAPVLIKIASSLLDIPSLERETSVYRLLHGSGATPAFLGQVVHGGRIIGFIIEYIVEVPSIRARNIQGCLAALRSLHQRGIAHGDAHDGNCLIRKDGSAILIDFELSLEIWSREEFERDLDVMGRCIQAFSEHSTSQ